MLKLQVLKKFASSGITSNKPKKNIKVKPFILEKVADNPNYVEIKLEKLGSTNVVYPNKPRFEANDFHAFERQCESRNYYNYN